MEIVVAAAGWRLVSVSGAGRRGQPHVGEETQRLQEARMALEGEPAHEVTRAGPITGAYGRPPQNLGH